MTERSEFALVPMGARILAALGFAIPVVGATWMFYQHAVIGWETLLGAGIGSLVAAYILLAGYVYGDAARRGMPPVPWTALAVMVPNGLGFVLYFLMRKPMGHPCNRCAASVAGDAAFCPRCGQAQTVSGVGEWQTS